MDSMHIEIPSGAIFLNGYRVVRLRYKPYIRKDGENVFLTEEQRELAKGMMKAFAPLIDSKPKKLIDYMEV